MPEMGMFVVAPSTTTSFHPQPQNHHESLIPLLATDINGGDILSLNRTAAIHLWQNSSQQQQQQQQHVGVDSSYPTKKTTIDFQACVPDNPVTGAGNGGGSATCQDCGNQAKKDCSHRRCRTCCRSRGFDCGTHVKSTWVPAARRRQLRSISAAGAGASSESTSGAKRRRLVSSTTNSNNSDTGSSRRETAAAEALPREVTAPAVFRCVRVTAVEGGEDEFAYQAVVKIGGHVFKGFLYDQGFNNNSNNPKISQLNSSSTAVCGGVSSAAAMISPMGLLHGGGGGAGAFLGGSALQYGNTTIN